MKKTLGIVAIFTIISACSISIDDLQGLWKVEMISRKNDDSFDHWKKLLDTTDVKVYFSEEGDLKTFFVIGDSVTFSLGSFILLEKDEKLQIDDTSPIFNPRGNALEIVSFSSDEMQLEGRYYLQELIPSVPADSFITAEWVLTK